VDEKDRRIGRLAKWLRAQHDSVDFEHALGHGDSSPAASAIARAWIFSTSCTRKTHRSATLEGCSRRRQDVVVQLHEVEIVATPAETAEVLGRTIRPLLRD
jgi:hypothetical protein